MFQPRADGGQPRDQASAFRPSPRTHRTGRGTDRPGRSSRGAFEPHSWPRAGAIVLWLRDRALTLALMAMFLLFLAGQLWTGLFEFSDERTAHGRPEVTLSEYLETPTRAIFVTAPTRARRLCRVCVGSGNARRAPADAGRLPLVFTPVVRIVPEPAKRVPGDRFDGLGRRVSPAALVAGIEASACPT